MNERPTHLDLFSGIGGFTLAAQWAGFRTIGFCEIDKYCQKVLAKNFLSQSDAFGCNGGKNHEGETSTERTWPSISSNIFNLDGTRYRGVDLITGGFPCQPFSVAGKRRGAADDRAIWPEMFRVIGEARPAWVLGENVPGIIPMELDNVLSDLEGIGYATRAFVVPACAVDARHRRDRVWIIGRNMGNTECTGSQRYWGEYGLRETGEEAEAGRSGDGISNSRLAGQSGPGQPVYVVNSTPTSNGQTAKFVDGSKPCQWLPEPDVGRVAHGISSRVDRLKGLGNAIVPAAAYEILREIRKQITP